MFAGCVGCDMGKTISEWPLFWSTGVTQPPPEVSPYHFVSVPLLGPGEVALAGSQGRPCQQILRELIRLSPCGSPVVP